jgi:hypothetical protein
MSDTNAPAIGAEIKPYKAFWVMLATTAETNAANKSCPSIAILITPHFSHSNPVIETKISGT